MKNQVLVAILNNHADFRIVCEQGWYRIPVSSVEKWLKKRWPPQWLAFYQTQTFKHEAHSIRHYAKVLNVRKVSRRQIFPNESPSPKQNKVYYQLVLAPLQQLPQPIYSRRWRRIVFISTTWNKFIQAIEINDLYDDSPLEDKLWAHFKRLDIDAERQELVRIKQQSYFLDFAIYCEAGKLDIETDGDQWHVGKENAAADNLRDNALKTEGWRVLRFNTQQIQEESAGYCVETIADNINRLGGLKTTQKTLPKKIDMQDKKGQMDLF